MIDKSPIEKPPIQTRKPSFLEDALGAMNRDLRMRGMQMKHGLKPLGEKDKSRKGYATQGGGYL